MPYACACACAYTCTHTYTHTYAFVYFVPLRLAFAFRHIVSVLASVSFDLPCYLSLSSPFPSSESSTSEFALSFV
jgi:hypothetical protein